MDNLFAAANAGSSFTYATRELDRPPCPSAYRSGPGHSRDVDPEDTRGAAVDRQQRGEHLQHRCLAGAVGAEHPEHLSLVDLEVDAIDRANGFERLDEADRFDREAPRIVPLRCGADVAQHRAHSLLGGVDQGQRRGPVQHHAMDE